MPTMIVLVNLKEGVSPGDYERWILESYAPAVKDLPSVADWRDYRVSGLLGSEDAPPYRYISDPRRIAAGALEKGIGPILLDVPAGGLRSRLVSALQEIEKGRFR